MFSDIAIVQKRNTKEEIRNEENNKIKNDSQQQLEKEEKIIKENNSQNSEKEIFEFFEIQFSKENSFNQEIPKDIFILNLKKIISFIKFFVKRFPFIPRPKFLTQPRNLQSNSMDMAWHNLGILFNLCFLFFLFFSFILMPFFVFFHSPFFVFSSFVYQFRFSHFLFLLIPPISLLFLFFFTFSIFFSLLFLFKMFQLTKTFFQSILKNKKQYSTTKFLFLISKTLCLK